MLIIQKGLKSLQLRLNEYVMSKNKKETVSNSAFTQARAKLKYTAFIEMNQKCIVDVVYGDEDYKKYKGMRVVAIDGSKIILPQEDDIIAEFGEVSYGSENTFTQGTYCYAMASVLYDVLNHIAIDSSLNKAKSSEIDLAVKHSEFIGENDLLICDRGYPSYHHLSHLIQGNKKFVMRCSSASFKEAREMLKGKGSADRVVTLKPSHARAKEIRELNLPGKIKVRFVRVKLDTGEYEVLVTNLFDKEEFPTEEFKTIYYMRWGIESFYAVLKTRLNLENFSGKTAHSVYQDFYSTVYISGLESILISDVDEEMANRDTKNDLQVNHNVSFNAIKNQALKLLLSEGNLSTDELIEQLENLFRTSPISINPEKKVFRRNTSDYQLLQYHKRKKKICF